MVAARGSAERTTKGEPKVEENKEKLAKSYLEAVEAVSRAEARWVEVEGRACEAHRAWQVAQAKTRNEEKALFEANETESQAWEKLKEARKI